MGQNQNLWNTEGESHSSTNWPIASPGKIEVASKLRLCWGKPKWLHEPCRLKGKKNCPCNPCSHGEKIKRLRNPCCLRERMKGRHGTHWTSGYPLTIARHPTIVPGRVGGGDECATCVVLGKE